jgi:hypothetical protein
MSTPVRGHDGSISPDTWEDLTPLATSLERQWPDLPVPIARHWSDHPVVSLDGGTPWLHGPLERDPLMGHSGPIVLPRRPRRQLRKMAAAGLRFPALVIAHELDPTGPVRSLLALLQDGPRTCTDDVARKLVSPIPAHPGATRAAALFDRLVGGDTVAWAGQALDVLLDPIVFGVVAPGPLVHGSPSLWYPLVAWRW